VTIEQALAWLAENRATVAFEYEGVPGVVAVTVPSRTGDRRDEMTMGGGIAEKYPPAKQLVAVVAKLAAERKPQQVAATEGSEHMAG
jgi:hypothetical protein